MEWVEVATQAELDALAGVGAIVHSGVFHASDSATVRASGAATVHASDSATVRASDSATVHASDSATVRASDSATVRASDSATVRASDSATVRASGSATVRALGSATVRAWGSATVHAWGSATVHAWDSATVRASGSATVHAWGSATVHATPWVAVHQHSTATTVLGGTLIDATSVDTPERWLAHHGVPVVDGKAVLAKAIDDDWKGTYKVPRLLYRPGRTVKAPDWNPAPRCGGGLHLSPCPAMALLYHPGATKFVAVEVDVADIVILDDKCKAPRGRVLFEVDIDGNRRAE